MVCFSGHTYSMWTFCPGRFLSTQWWKNKRNFTFWAYSCITCCIVLRSCVQRSTLQPWPVMMRISAGTLSPPLISTRSPTTNSLALIWFFWPSRITIACCGRMLEEEVSTHERELILSNLFLMCVSPVAPGSWSWQWYWCSWILGSSRSSQLPRRQKLKWWPSTAAGGWCNYC